MILDLFFYSLSFIAFYKNITLSLLSVIFLLMIYRFTNYYGENLYERQLDVFIDFLNQINSNLYLGLSVETSILQLNIEKKKIIGKFNHSGNHKDAQNDLHHVINHLKTAISIGINGGLLLDELYKLFPIDECRLYVEMLKLSNETGASINKITEVTLSNLYTRFQTVSEAKMIVYQKKIEQMILSIAPILIIIFIGISSGDFLEMLYTSTLGRYIMTISFVLLIIMKNVGRKIVGTIQ